MAAFPYLKKFVWAIAGGILIGCNDPLATNRGTTPGLEGQQPNSTLELHCLGRSYAVSGQSVRSYIDALNAGVAAEDLHEAAQCLIASWRSISAKKGIDNAQMELQLAIAAEIAEFVRNGFVNDKRVSQSVREFLIRIIETDSNDLFVADAAVALGELRAFERADVLYPLVSSQNDAIWKSSIIGLLLMCKEEIYHKLYKITDGSSKKKGFFENAKSPFVDYCQVDAKAVQ